MYSKNAMPQLTSAATIHGRPLSSFKCAYHANVMKTLLSERSTIVKPMLRMALDRLTARERVSHGTLDVCGRSATTRAAAALAVSRSGNGGRVGRRSYALP